MVVKVSDKLDEIGERYILQSYLLQIFQDHGEELISSYEHGKSTAYLVDWRKACERIYKYITLAFSTKGFGNGVSWVVTDSLCNQHLTSQECFERAVRIPAALKAAKEAGAGGSDRIQLMTAVAEKYLEMADKEVIKRAHSKTYIQRIKKRCKSVTQEREVVSLTEDSDGNGGHDTSTYLFMVYLLNMNRIHSLFFPIN